MKADGARFERQFRDVFSSDYIVHRLHVMKAGYAGMSQPADFIVVGDSFNYVELKETARDRLSISTLQQYDTIKEFLEKRKEFKKRNTCDVNYILVVNFLGKGICILANEAITDFGESNRTLKYDEKYVAKVKDLRELKEWRLF